MKAFLKVIAAALFLSWRLGAQPIEELGQNIHEIEYIPQAPGVVIGAGVKWVRLVAWWKWMEPSQGQIDFSQLDQRVSSAVSNGLSVLIMFTSIPPWANGSSPTCDFWGGQCAAPPTNTSYFSAFATAVVNRYKEDVQHWEIWNEPDYNAFWTGTISEWVNKILTPGATAIRTADPSAKIVGPATYSGISSFQIWVPPSCSQLDYLSQHFYVDNVALMLTRIDNQFLPWIATNCSKPLWVTEMGIDSWVKGEAVQASEYVAAYQGSVARSGLAKMFVFHWADGQAVFGGAGYGFVENDLRLYRKKRSYWEVSDYTLSLSGVPNRTVTRDSFANNTGPRAVGAPVSGTQSEFGARTWAATGTLVFGTCELTTSIGGDVTHAGGVPFAPPVNPALPIHAIESDLVLDGTKWIGMGFSPDAAGGLWSSGTVWVLVRPTGEWSAHANGLQMTVGSGVAPTFSPSGLNHVELRYNRTTNQVRVNVNANTVLPDYQLGSFVPSLAFADVHVQTAPGSAPGQARVDSFRVLSLPVILENPLFADGFETGNTSVWSSTCTSC